jgi:PhzF family phenazine biosynthesis protein
MSRRVRVFQVDAFTDRRFCGNPAGVVLDADTLNEPEMQALARELNNGDTIFLLQPDGSDHDVRARFFTPRREAPFVGHATLAAHAVLAHLGLPRRVRQKQSSGIVTVRTLQDSPPRIAIAQPPPPLGRTLTQSEIDRVTGALGLQAAQLHPDCPPRLAGPGSRVLLGLRAPGSLSDIVADSAQLVALSAELGAAGYFVFALHGDREACWTEARMFCPALGIPEDPVSGNAHAMLAVYLRHYGLIDPGVMRFRGEQGHFMGRPGHVQVDLQRDGDALQSIVIGGTAAIVFATELDFP